MTKSMKDKNKYYVVNIYSSHNNFENAEANQKAQISAGKDSHIYYRGEEVFEDVKKKMKGSVGI